MHFLIISIIDVKYFLLLYSSIEHWLLNSKTGEKETNANHFVAQTKETILTQKINTQSVLKSILNVRSCLPYVLSPL